MTQDDMTAGGSAAGSSSLAETGRETYEEVKTKASHMAARTLEAARDEALSRSEAAKDSLAEVATRLADALRGAAEDGPHAGVQARLMTAAADAIEDLSESVRGRPLGELLGEADAFARRNPGAFVAAAALAGFAIARFARASAPDEGAAVRSAGSFAGRKSGQTGHQAMSEGASSRGGPSRGGARTTGLNTHDDEDGARP
ncbi:hypothetical protein ruthe_02737 [Rubellimicrobium thermophilum DSM 16684]|uniref:Uncharacterized protein n=1 Tax=Rubellimicrobium thermophilum DSM 16684 TaxID=1123069 RepID=S9RYQ2_9RHOB|nr:hypothetical protein [Rubellimicrobium thermophilum]EPX83120.1 hypothetical protein ruthe_02737 [Rubellimicrobium thermophilum DSM 16684]